MSPESQHAPHDSRQTADVAQTYDLQLLDQSIQKWRSSPALRAAYGSIYREMAACVPPGPALEVGSGCGTMREYIEHLTTSDVCKTRFVDRAASAYALEEVAGGPWSAILLFDVLHHLREPFRFFESASRALAQGGRIIICEPAATPLGRLAYKFAHHEPVEPERLQAPWVFPADSADGDFANMGMGWALFARERENVATELARFDLRITRVSFRDVIAYACTGGFSRKSLLPAGAVCALLRVEQMLPQSVLQRIGMRMVIVLERTHAMPREIAA